MGIVYAEITLVNAGDEIIARRGSIKESEIRQTTVTAIVDTGTMNVVINEEIRQLLGLEVTGYRQAELADGSLNKYAVAEPIIVQWKNRSAVSNAIVLPNSNEVLLGVIPLEEMDLIVSPVSQELVGAHGEDVILKIK